MLLNGKLISVVDLTGHLQKRKLENYSGRESVSLFLCRNLWFIVFVSVAIIPDAKTPNTATFMISKEDHTIGNLLRM